MQTHTVFNQASPLSDYDMFASDLALKESVTRYDAAWALDRISRFGRYAGSAEAIEWAIQANDNPPVLSTHDRFGNRIDAVNFHPAYHQLMAKSIEFGVHALPWQEQERRGAHVARAALLYMDFQNEAGHCCPISMTYSVVPSLRKQASLADIWEPLIKSSSYDSRFIPFAQKTGVTVGMGMTEKQGGSDVRANTTKAEPISSPGSGNAYRLNGHKWFCSAPMSDAFLILAQTHKGISCFLVPRFLPDGSKNAIFIQRLKDKLGNHSNASSEIELLDSIGFLVGEEGRGVATIIEMVNHTRLDCIAGSAALMRQATIQAIHHCSKRSAFGKLLIDQALMINVLADLSLETEAAVRLLMRVASAYDKPEDEQERAFKRLSSAVAKYWICKRTPATVAEGLECLGGNGYVESGPMPRLFRESPLLGIWEGSGNVICLDVLRAIAKEPDTLDAYVIELERTKGANDALDQRVNALKKEIAAFKSIFSNKSSSEQIEACETKARLFVEKMAVCLQSSLMLRYASGSSSDLFLSSRLANGRALAFGTLDGDKQLMRQVVEQAFAH